MLLIAFALATSFSGLGSGPPLGDHECIVAQAARQIRQTDEWLIPYVGEIPRVRKAPFGYWAVALSSQLFDGDVNKNVDWAVDKNAGAVGNVGGSVAGNVSENVSRDVGDKVSKTNLNLPVNELSARLPSAAASFLTAMVVYWLGRMMFGRRAGLIAGFVWAASTGAILMSRNAQVDMILALFTTLSFAMFWAGAVRLPRNRWAMIGFYVAFAAAMMSKAPLPLATVGMPLAIFWLLVMPLFSATDELAGGAVVATTSRVSFILQRCWRIGWQQFRRVFSTLWFFPGVVLWLVLFGAWPWYISRHVPDAVALWKAEYIDMSTGEGDEKTQPFFFYFPVIFALAGPYLLSIPEAVAAAFMARYRQQRLGLLFAFTWAVWGLLFLSVVSTKRWHYLIS
ncbi:MAG: glycosyltransferase family 39 protein, partial [Phycisphaerae bacterium]|nr:glycosyltransferase family 39 protein [Phycisphaerae bacterium]